MPERPQTLAERRRQLFYAEQEAGLYDETIELVVPQYTLLHKTMQDLLNNHFKRAAEEDTGGKFAVLDIGSGTGADSLPVLRRWPNCDVVAVDLCDKMHAVFRENFERDFPDEHFTDRVTTITDDIASPRTSASILTEVVKEKTHKSHFDAVVSAFAIHHLDHDEKAQAYQTAYDCLSEGGLFLNADLYSFASSHMSELAHHHDLAFIRQNFVGKGNESLTVTAKTTHLSLRDKWIHHYEHENILEPIWGNSGQAQLLESVGFREVSCPFRHLQCGLLWALK